MRWQGGAAERRYGGEVAKGRGGDGFTIVSHFQGKKGSYDDFSRVSRKVFRKSEKSFIDCGRSNHEDGRTRVVSRRRERASRNQARSSIPRERINVGDLHAAKITSTGRRSPQRVCFRCGGRDHIASACRDPVICFTCKRTGHKSFNCEQRRSRMAGWVSDIGLGISDDMRRRIDQLKTCEVVSLLQGSCRPCDISSILQRKTGDVCQWCLPTLPKCVRKINSQ